MPRFLENGLEEAAKSYKAKTYEGVCDGFHPKYPLDLTKETRIEVMELLEEVGSVGDGRRKLAQRYFS